MMDSAITGFLGALEFDLNAFESYFPAAADYYEVIQGFAIGLLLIMLVFQLFRNFGVMLDIEAEDPLKMVGKIILFYGMIQYCRSITNLVIKLLTDPYSIFLNTYSTKFSFSITDLTDNIFTGLMVPSFLGIVYLIMLLILGWQFLKFIVEVVERYVVFHFIIYCAPVVMATGAFKSTSQIFKSWCRMLGSQAMLLILNIWSIKLFTSFMTVFNFASGDVIFCFLLGYGFLKFSQKADTLLRILGLNTASTGNVMHSLGSTIGGIAMAMRSAGNMANRISGGRHGGKDSFDRKIGNSSSHGNGSTTGGIAMQGEQSPFVKQGISDSTGGANPNITKAAQNYANEVLSSAKQQMDCAGLSVDSGTGTGTSAGSAPDNNTQEIMGKIGASPHDGGSVQNVDRETKEGLDNLAHGLPHENYDSQSKKHSGGGFQEFTGANANIIGTSQFIPKDGVSQSQVKMPDGSAATIYQDSQTGRSHLVQFGSVDNGVMQGCISEIDNNTGKLGDAMAFKAVHGSVPGAQSFSSHATPVSDGGNGSYHIATGADTSFLRTEPMKADIPDAQMGQVNNEHSAISHYEVGGGHVMPGMTTGVDAVTPVPSTAIGTASTVSQNASMGDTTGAGSANMLSQQQPEGNYDQSPHITQTPLSSQAGIKESPQISETMQKNGNQLVRRFSQENPAHTEVFQRRIPRDIETFARNQMDTGQNNNFMNRKENPYEKKK